MNTRALDIEQVRIEVRCHLDVGETLLVVRKFRALQVLGDDLVYAHDFRLHHPPPGEGQQVLHDLRGLLAGTLDGDQRFPEGGVFLPAVEQQHVRVADEPAENVVQVVGDPAREHAERFHLFARRSWLSIDRFSCSLRTRSVTSKITAW